MSLDYLPSGIGSAALLIYPVYALVRPEHF
jgi:K+-transporting ATPase KdpF subunit